MRGVVSIGRFRKKKEKEEREWMELDEKMDSFECTVAVDTENHTEESAIAVLAAMAELNDAMANNPFGRYVAREQQKREDDFKKRYKDVFARAPDMPVARIKYFCGVLLKLWPDVEKGGVANPNGQYLMTFSAFIRKVWTGHFQTGAKSTRKQIK